ncbi:MAG: MBL fold metallo-hydrolase [Ruminococcus sp.]|nr:MBL fold metallo-hydrolase [Ruminococcus sp.]
MIYPVSVKGVFVTNCYFYIDDETGHGFLIDPGADAKELLDIVKRNLWTIEKILLTHGHFDHFGAALELGRRMNCDIMAYHLSDKYLLNPQMNLSVFCGESLIVDNTTKFEDGDNIALKNHSDFTLKVISCPGHTEDSVIFYSERDSVVFVGDTIFRESLGNSEYPGGSLVDLTRSIYTKIFTLPDETVLYSGHTRETTVGYEKIFHRIFQ